MSQKVKIAGVQFAGSPDMERNLRRAGELLELAARNGARLAVLPEFWAYPWFLRSVDEAAKELAQPANGPLLTAMREKTRACGLAAVVPFFEKDGASGAAYNSAAVIGHDGEIAGVYRKVHVPQIPGWEERSYFRPGDRGFPVFDSPVGRLGVQLGWDLLFPEGLRALALAGAEIVVAPVAISAANDDLWRCVVQAGALANGLWVCRVGRIGRENDLVFAGGSLCAAPTGDLLDEPAGDAEGVTLWDIDRRVGPMVRRDWPLLKDRRPDQYAALAAAAPAEPAPAEIAATEPMPEPAVEENDEERADAEGTA
jgi:N-carbamoylputrescine amidase